MRAQCREQRIALYKCNHHHHVQGVVKVQHEGVHAGLPEARNPLCLVRSPSSPEGMLGMSDVCPHLEFQGCRLIPHSYLLFFCLDLLLFLSLWLVIFLLTASGTIFIKFLMIFLLRVGLFFFFFVELLLSS